MHKKDNTQMCFKDFIQAQAQAANAKLNPAIKGARSPENMPWNKTEKNHIKSFVCFARGCFQKKKLSQLLTQLQAKRQAHFQYL